MVVPPDRVLLGRRAMARRAWKHFKHDTRRGRIAAVIYVFFLPPERRTVMLRYHVPEK